MAAIQFATSPKRETSLEQRVAYRQPLPAIDLGESRAGRDSERSAGSQGWRGEPVPESPGLYHQHLQRGAGASSMRSPALHNSVPFTPDQPHRRSLQWSSPISDFHTDVGGRDDHVAISPFAHLCVCVCLCSGVCVCVCVRARNGY